MEQQDVIRFLRERIAFLEKDLNRNKKGFDILMEYFDSISDEEKLKVHERLKEIDL